IPPMLSTGMKYRSCYRRNLATPPPSPISQQRPSGEAPTSLAVAVLAAILCALGCLGLASCGKSTGQYIERGNQLFASGRYGDATLNYRNAIKKSPDSGEAYYRMGLALLRQNQVGESYQAFNHAVTLSPKNMRAKVELASL